MTLQRSLSGTALLLAALLFAASHAHAQASRTWVSGVGDDANPCSRTAPCKTFAGAISKTAAGGEIDALDPGGYGAVTITKAITINGRGTHASVLVSGTNGIVVAAGTSDVVILRNLSVIGLGTGINGISFLSGARLVVENVTIDDFSQQGIYFQPNAASNLFVTRSAIHNNAGGGIFVQPTSSGTANAVIEAVELTGNLRGVRAEDGASVEVRNTIASEGTASGFVAVGTSRAVDMMLENCVASRNALAGVHSGSLATIRVSNTVVTRNNVGFEPAGGGAIISFGNNRVNGNATDGAPTSTTGSL